MIFHLFRRVPQEHSIAALYGMIVAQARAPVFYQIYRVPDTVNGRMEMIILHAVLMLYRLNREPEPHGAVGQGIFDMFCDDMDANLREMGVGDLAVPKAMRGIAEAFYGRQAAYLAALDDDQALAEVLARNVYDSGVGADAPPLAAPMATYVRKVVSHLAAQLAAQDARALSSGVASFPQPDAVAAGDIKT
jgi:cytochrome b pre-mRNA-processing protein 3